MNINTVIFDFGGVLLKWNPHNMIRSYFSNDQTAMESFFKEIKFSEWNAQQDQGRSFSDGVQVLSKEFPEQC